uniref:Uncharacterized protein n=1 Tax=Anguilla anguilla TaxID=7936 RepID=A0A0E9U6J6_ANGAN
MLLVPVIQNGQHDNSQIALNVSTIVIVTRLPDS